MWLFGSLWDRWTIAFKLTTPLLHVLFMSCQMWGSWNFYKMYQRQTRLLRAANGDVEQSKKYEPQGEELQPRSQASSQPTSASDWRDMNMEEAIPRAVLA